MVNVASQLVRGVDLSVDYKMGTESNSRLLFLNGTYLDLAQQNTPQSPEQNAVRNRVLPSEISPARRSDLEAERVGTHRYHQLSPARD